MDNESLSEHWWTISKALAAVMRKFDRLPEEEQDQEVRDWLEGARIYAENRELALIDPE